ncbi:hypothetical protein [Flavobacterium sp. SM2513]|uniref:hypothetical protein n=1 Tax=Flavobacterium sp. SM2513 TaxID=3424766 RepID=UPI003D7F6059
MLKTQRNNYNMFLAVEHCFNTRPDAWNTNVPVSATKNKFSALLKNLEEHLRIQLENNTGIAIDKLTLRKSLQNQGYQLSAAASVYALQAPKIEFYNKIHFIKSHFILLRDLELQSLCTDLSRDCATETEHLIPYGITAETFATFDADIKKFALIKVLPKEMYENRKRATAALAVLIREITTLLTTQMDALMVGLNTTAPEFVGIYKNLRKIKHVRVTALSLITKVINATTGRPIKGATLIVVGTLVKRVSTQKGGNTVLHLSEGVHEIKVSHNNYKSEVEKFTIIKGLATHLIIKLQPLGQFAKGLKPLNKSTDRKKLK